MKKIIITSITSALLIIIAVTTLVLALIPVNQNSLIEKPFAVYIMNKNTKDLSQDNGTFSLKSYKQNYENESEKIDKLYELFNENFGQKLLTAIFRGEVNNKMVAKYDKPVGPGNSITKNYDSSNKYTVVFEYKTTKENDETQYSQKIKVDGKEDFGYKYLFFEVKPGEERSEVIFGVSKYSNFDEYRSSIDYEYFYTCVTNLNNVHEYISNLDYFKNKAN